ncbi:MAG TPA: GNAT family N-acetyltransferase [Nocardioidaceae bacterium]|nr:GNAT family N-acetyltransferase [Nocardioidaceae bacterium]
MSADLVIRLALANEAELVGRITADAYLHEGYVQPDGPYVAVLQDAISRAERAELWVADLDGAIVGTVTFCPPGSPFRQTATAAEGEFRALAVSAGARGHGVGRRLVEQCFERCRLFGLRQLVLLSQEQMAPAHRLYAAMGFVRDSALDWSPAPGVCLQGFRADVPSI